MMAALQQLRSEVSALRRRSAVLTTPQRRLAKTYDDGAYPTQGQPGQAYPITFLNRDLSERGGEAQAINQGEALLPVGRMLLVTLHQSVWFVVHACCVTSTLRADSTDVTGDTTTFTADGAGA